MNKLNFLGVGPRIAIVLLPWLVVSIVLTCSNERFFGYTAESSKIILIAGIILMTAGVAFYFATVKMLLKGLKETRLITKGPYSLCQNPLYSSLLLFIIPALSFLLNSWLVLTSGLVGYILLKLFIKSEYRELEKFFGEEYLKYKKETPEFFPIPFKKKGKGSDRLMRLTSRLIIPRLINILYEYRLSIIILRQLIMRLPTVSSYRLIGTRFLSNARNPTHQY